MRKISAILILLLTAAFFPPPVLSQDASVQVLIEAIKANPKDTVAHFNLATAYFNQQKYDMAAGEYQKCVQLDSNDKVAKERFEMCLGIQAYLQKNFSGAADHFQAVIKINPKNTEVYPKLANSYVKLQEYPKAEAVLKDFSSISPENKDSASEVLSQMYMGQKRYSEAVTELRTVVGANPKNFGAFQNLGFAYFQLKDYKDSAQAWEKAVRIEKDAQIYKFLGFSYYNLGDFASATENYRKSIQLESSKDQKEQNFESLAETHYNMAVAFRDNGLFDKAADEFGAAFKINPKDSNAAVGQAQAIEAATNSHMEKASSYLLNNQYSDAISEWQMVLKYQPDNKQAKDFITDAQTKLTVEVRKHIAAGKSFKQKNNPSQALSEFNLALKMDPNNPDIKKLINGVIIGKKLKVKSLLAEGDEYYQAKDYSSALASYLEAKKIDPQNSGIKARLKKLKSKQSNEFDTVYDKAMANYKKGDLKSALKNLTLAKQFDPSNQKVLNSLFKVQKDIAVRIKDLDAEGASLFDSGSKDKAQARFQEVLKLKPNDETANDYIKKMTGQQSHEKADAEQVKALYYDGVNLYINGKIHEAIGKWQECLKQDPGNVNAQKNIDKAMVKLQSIEKLSHN